MALFPVEVRVIQGMKESMLRLAFALALLLIQFGPAVRAAGIEPDSLTDTGPRRASFMPVARLEPKDLAECSGMAFTGGAFWAHNDADGGPFLYRSSRLDFADAEVLRVPDAENEDWEDLTVIDGDILVCDIGDNLRSRQGVVVYRVRYHPAQDGNPSRLETVARYPIRYPDGPHDAEAALVIDGKLHIVIKNRGEKTTTVFRLEELKDVRETSGVSNPALPVGELELAAGEQITSGDYDARSGTVVLLSYAHLLHYKGDQFQGAPVKKTRIMAFQCESVCFNGTQLVISNEQRFVYAINDYLARDYDALLFPLGRASLPLLWNSKSQGSQRQ